EIDHVLRLVALRRQVRTYRSDPIRLEIDDCIHGIDIERCRRYPLSYLLPRRERFEIRRWTGWGATAIQPLELFEQRGHTYLVGYLRGVRRKLDARARQGRNLSCRLRVKALSHRRRAKRCTQEYRQAEKRYSFHHKAPVY